jgi:hypothetical protein
LVSKILLNKLPDHFPVPIRQFYSSFLRRCLNRILQLGLLAIVEYGGEPPVCSKASPWGPSRSRWLNHSPIVWGSLFNFSATSFSNQPWARSQIACQRSRSRPVGAWYIYSRTDLISKINSLNRAVISLTSLLPYWDVFFISAVLVSS